MKILNNLSLLSSFQCLCSVWLLCVTSKYKEKKGNLTAIAVSQMTEKIAVPMKMLNIFYGTVAWKVCCFFAALCNNKRHRYAAASEIQTLYSLFASCISLTFINLLPSITANETGTMSPSRPQTTPTSDNSVLELNKRQIILSCVSSYNTSTSNTRYLRWKKQGCFQLLPAS